MITITWDNPTGGRNTICAADNESAFVVYWALKKLYETYYSVHDCYLYMYRDGTPVSPESGVTLHPRKDNEPVTVLCLATILKNP